MEPFIITDKSIDIETVYAICNQNQPIALSNSVKQKIQSCSEYLMNKNKNSDEPIYGVNTGFGALCEIKIESGDLHKLQENLVKSHACGTGDLVPNEIVKIMLLLKICSLCHGYSGIQLKTIERLIDFFNHSITQLIYTQGSLGASGDLAPLAHLALPLLGLGEVYYKGKKYSGAEILKKFNWEKIQLQAKEGLALLNGTQFMSAYGVYLYVRATKLLRLADVITGLSMEAYQCLDAPLKDVIHRLRPHTGQLETARYLLKILKGSQLINGSSTNQVQDPYSFRCVPQVHGASKDAFNHCKETMNIEINSVTDNPIISVEDDIILSGGNFHGQPLALTLDYFAIAMAELGSVSERRIFKLVSGNRGLPPFLIENSGINSGFMIPQYTAASIVSQNKQLATPSSIDSITSSNGQEDHVSMGANAATKAFKIVENVNTVLAIELFSASQALCFRNPKKSSPFLENFLEKYRSVVPYIKEDMVLYEWIHKSNQFLKEVDV